MKSRTAIFAFLLAVGAATAVDRLSPATMPVSRGISVPTQGGVLACPIALATRGRGFLRLANLGRAPSRVRVSLIPRSGKTVVLTLGLDPRAVTGVGLDGRVKGAASAVVEYAGGEVVASHLLVLPPGSFPSGAAEAPCVATGEVDTVVAPARTLRAETTLAVFNPGSADADVSISLYANGRVFEPERLARRIIPARHRRDFTIGDFVFDARDVVVLVHAFSGRVVAEGLLEAGQGVELVPGQQPGRSPVAISGVSGTGVLASVAAIGDEDAVLQGRVAGVEGSGGVLGLPSTVHPEGTRRFLLPSRSGGRAAAFVFHVAEGAPVAAGTTWPVTRSGGGDLLALPALSPAFRWGGVFGATTSRATVRALVVNPGSRPARIHLAGFGSRGSAIRDAVVPPGRLLAIALTSAPGTFAAEVTSDAPIAVAFDVVGSTPGGEVRAAAVAGVPLQSPVPISVIVDVRAGVSAPIRNQ